MVFNELLMQFQADMLDVPVIRPTVAETTALGAAYAAGLAVGFWDDIGRLARQLARRPRVAPAHGRAQRATGCMRGWRKAVTRTFDWV